MPSALNLYNAIYAKLTAATGVGTLYAAVGGRIRLVRGQHNEDTPRCDIEPQSNTPFRHFDGAGDDVELAFIIRLYGDKESATQPFPPESLVACQDKLNTLLDRQVITATGWGNVQTWATDYGNLDIDNDAWVIVTVWRLTASPS